MVILNSKYCDLEALIESLVESGGDPIAAIYNYLELQERSKENE